MGYAYPSNNEKSEKYGKNNAIQDAGELLRVITVVENTAVKKRDSSVRIPVDDPSIAGKINCSLNDVIELNRTKSVV